MTHTTEQITAGCALFACRVCRTKTGWRHQSWCSRAEKKDPGCAGCMYFDQNAGACAYPRMERGGRGKREKENKDIV